MICVNQTYSIYLCHLVTLYLVQQQYKIKPWHNEIIKSDYRTQAIKHSSKIVASTRNFFLLIAALEK